MKPGALFSSLSFPSSLSLSVFFLSRCLPQKVTAQQQEINNSVQRRTTVDEESALMKKELTALREQLVNNSQELKVGGTNFLWQCGASESKSLFPVWH